MAAAAASAPPPPCRQPRPVAQSRQPLHQQLLPLLLLLLLLFVPWVGAYNTPSTSRPPQQPSPTQRRRPAHAPAAATAGATPRRAHALRLIAAGALGLAAAGAASSPPSSFPLLPLQPAAAAAAAGGGGVRSLVNLMRVQSYVQELARTLRASPDGAPPEVNAQIKYIVKTMNMRESAADAAASLGGGEAARRHGRDAFEYVSSIIEFSGWDEMKKSTVSKYNALSSPERVAFALRCLEACDRELTAMFQALPPRTMQEARDVYRAYFAPEEGM